MNVVCGECSTEYEFDDALVSERGTTVKCTNCGHQFRVMPKTPSVRHVPEHWSIRKPSGVVHEFPTLGDLQRGIANHQISIDDRISKDGQPFRPIREVAELLPFFRQAPPIGEMAPQRGKGTLIGMAAQPGRQPLPQPEKAGPTLADLMPASVRETPLRETPAPVPSIKPRVIEGPKQQRVVPEARRKTPLGGLAPDKPPADVEIPPASSIPQEALGGEGLGGSTGVQRAVAIPKPAELEPESAAPDLEALLDPVVAEQLGAQPDPSAAESNASVESNADAPKTQRTTDPPAPPAKPSIDASPIPVREAEPGKRRTPSPPIARRKRRRDDQQTLASASDPPPAKESEVRPPKSVVPAPLSVPPPPKGGGMRWVAALAVVGVLALLALTVGRDYLTQFVTSEPQTAKQDQRVDSLLDAASDLLATGDLEGAKANYDKASVLADDHRGVAIGLANVEAIRADRLWLKLKLLPTEPAAALQAAQSELDLRRKKLEVALATALKLAPTDARSKRLTIEQLRLNNKVSEARQHAGGLTSDAEEPETAYVLAALDVAEDAPSWPTVLERLRTASSGDRGLGRSRALLVYAAAKSGDLTQARSELEKLKAAPFPNPLVEALAGFVERQADSSSETANSAAQATQSAKAPASEGRDFRTALVGASKARRRGDLGSAERLYLRALERQPGNVEAVAGLGLIAKQRGQGEVAASYFKRALADNPGYLPALVGSADLKWASGDRAGAVKLYRRVGPGSLYTDHAKKRIAIFEASELPSQTATASPSTGAATGATGPDVGALSTQSTSRESASSGAAATSRPGASTGPAVGTSVTAPRTPLTTDTTDLPDL